MRYLLDTHVFLWWIQGDDRLPAPVRELIATGGNRIHVSAASGWEIAVKAGLGRIRLPDAAARFLPEQLRLNHFAALPIQMAHALALERLPRHHRDPFDRMLVVQAQLEEMPLISRDPLLHGYELEVIWA